MLRIALLIGLFVFHLAATAEEGPPEAVPDPPDIPPPVTSGEPMEPDVTIIRKGGTTVEEYRRNNRVYRVRVTPVIGPPYYMEDMDGDGNLDVRRSDNERGLRINQWVLFRW